MKTEENKEEHMEMQAGTWLLTLPSTAFHKTNVSRCASMTLQRVLNEATCYVRQ